MKQIGVWIKQLSVGRYIITSRAMNSNQEGFHGPERKFGTFKTASEAAERASHLFPGMHWVYQPNETTKPDQFFPDDVRAYGWR